MARRLLVSARGAIGSSRVKSGTSHSVATHGLKLVWGIMIIMPVCKYAETDKLPDGLGKLNSATAISWSQDSNVLHL